MLCKKISLTSFVLASLFIAPAFAQEAPDLAAERALSTQLHEVWGVRDDVKNLVDLVTSKIPAAQQAEFRKYMSQVLDLKKIQEISVESAVEIFSQEELAAMVAYYSSAEGQSAEAKRKQYNEKITPLIQDMMHKGMAEAMKGFNQGN